MATSSQSDNEYSQFADSNNIIDVIDVNAVNDVIVDNNVFHSFRQNI